MNKKVVICVLCTMGIMTSQLSASALSVSADSIEGYNSNAGASLALASTLAASAAGIIQTSVYEEPADTYCGYTNLGIASVDGNLNVREAASEDSDIVGKMSDGAACEIVSQDGDWYQIESGSVSGYVMASYILTGDEAYAAAQEEVETIATVNTTTLNVRAEPNTDSKIIYLVPIDEELEVTEDLGDWIEVNIDDDIVYVSAEYVDLSQKLPHAKTMTEVKYGEGVSDVRVSLVNYALQFVGNPYVWGGTSLTNGADCSGFVLSVFAQYGIYLPHSSKAQAGYGTKISASEAQPGDLFFYGSGKSISHVAIYIGNGQIVHASSKKTGIKISSAYYRTPITVRRILTD